MDISNIDRLEIMIYFFSHTQKIYIDLFVTITQEIHASDSHKL